MGLLPETSWQFSQSSWRRPSYDCNGPRSIPPPGVLQGAMAKESPESCSGAPSAAIFVLRPPRSETRHPSSPGPPPRPHRATRRRAEAGGARGQSPSRKAADLLGSPPALSEVCPPPRARADRRAMAHRTASALLPLALLAALAALLGRQAAFAGASARGAAAAGAARAAGAAALPLGAEELAAAIPDASSVMVADASEVIPLLSFISSIFLGITGYSIYTAFGPPSEDLRDPFEEHDD
ncbi:unnamed protein product [Prorocentrum cordatum]|uniref:Protein PsbN n=1 Tax=Prorocentrum cordatum TaxID=2364126 RepID=A0ABN9V6S2_9DINO|nr:unnamed protein product [Polarella glacialis]